MLSQKKILIIDSSDSTRAILFKELLSSAPDLDIIACGTAKEAITACKRFEFDIITTGLSLPDMGGYEMIDNIRDQMKNKDTPIFVVSGDTKTQIITNEESDRHAITAFFDKAEGHTALVEFIANYLEEESTNTANILYVDPSATSAAITKSILTKNNFNFRHVTEGQDAVDILKADAEASPSSSFDLLITDLSLSNQMAGFELIQFVRNDIGYDYLTLPILLMTMEPGEGENTDFTGIFGAGTNDFITKPLTEKTLIERITNLVDIKRQNEALQE